MGTQGVHPHAADIRDDRISCNIKPIAATTNQIKFAFWVQDDKKEKRKKKEEEMRSGFV